MRHSSTAGSSPLRAEIELGGFDAAADRLHVTTSAISQRIKARESDEVLGKSAIMARIVPSLANHAKRYSLKATRISAMAPRPAMKPAMMPAIEYGMGPTSARSTFISWRC